MALNWTMLERGTPVPLPDERMISTEPKVEIVVKIPDAPPQGGATAGGSGGAGRTLRALGTAWLSDQRFIFVASPDNPPPTSIQSLSLPYHLVLSTKFEQPFFSANYLNMAIYPTPDGGLTAGTMVELRFPDRGMFSWVELLTRTREQALIKRRDEQLGDPLPLYVPPPPSETSRTEDAGVERPPAYDG
ncbi:hypothetical protein FRB99_000334 [Tulasnella sp. 403]|nr:hypothetical protein FRB99_000334 [Tulasnella sp. 403]